MVRRRGGRSAGATEVTIAALHVIAFNRPPFAAHEFFFASRQGPNTRVQCILPVPMLSARLQFDSARCHLEPY
jgi:hypothetical protein